MDQSSYEAYAMMRDRCHHLQKQLTEHEETIRRLCQANEGSAKQQQSLSEQFQAEKANLLERVAEHDAVSRQTYTLLLDFVKMVSRTAESAEMARAIEDRDLLELEVANIATTLRALCVDVEDKLT